MGLELEFILEPLVGGLLVWNAECLSEPPSRLGDAELLIPPTASPRLSFDMPPSSSTLIGVVECTAVGLTIEDALLTTISSVL